MHLLLLRTMVRFLLPLTLLFSVFVFARGHHEPGGGFVGGLVAAAALVLWIIAGGARHARDEFPVDPSLLAAMGLGFAGIAAVLPAFAGEPMLKSMWVHVPLPGGGSYELGTTTLFDLGVYFVVVGVVLLFVFTLELRPSRLEEEEDS
ncbi:MAG: Na+/H+ antiporter subunit B [Myxococcales bacterium]|nr:Na+/H+ antiporter subunit B [Myxococcales bacterium]